ncbi:hypothetical protein V6N13_033121 [Hibiscus sabdariffa]
MAIVLLVATAPTVVAACNEVKPFSIVNIRNPMANIFWMEKPVGNCFDSGYSPCYEHLACCSGSGYVFCFYVVLHFVMWFICLLDV